MTLITAHEWAEFLTVSVALNQDIARIHDECAGIVEYIGYMVTVILADKHACVVEDADAEVIVHALNHLVLTHDLRPTRRELWPPAFQDFGHSVIKILQFMDRVNGR